MTTHPTPDLIRAAIADAVQVTIGPLIDHAASGVLYALGLTAMPPADGAPGPATEGPRTTPDNPVASTIAPNNRDVHGRCPACGWTTLSLGSGGYITCGRLECPDPEAVTTLLERDVRREQASVANTDICGFYLPPTDPADSGCCARCGMYDWKHAQAQDSDNCCTTDARIRRLVSERFGPSLAAAVDAALDAADLKQSRAEAEAWRRKAIRRGLKAGRLRTVLDAVHELAAIETPACNEWSIGYQGAIDDLREILRELDQDGETPAETGRIDNAYWAAKDDGAPE